MEKAEKQNHCENQLIAKVLGVRRLVDSSASASLGLEGRIGWAAGYATSVLRWRRVGRTDSQAPGKNGKVIGPVIFVVTPKV